MNAMTGHNIPPTDADPLMDRLREDHASLLERRDELLGGIDRAPDAIDDEKTAGVMADFVEQQINKFLKAVKAVHENEKAPFLGAGRTVDSFKHTLIDDIEKGKAKLNTVRKAYADAKAAEERRRREEEERKAREVAKKMQEEADARAAELREQKDMDAALEAEDNAKLAQATAEKAAKAAAAKPAELGKSRGEYGGQTTLKQFWNFTNLNRSAIDLDALRSHLPADALDKAVRSWINANKDSLAAGKTLAGVRIFEDTRL